MSQPAFFVCLPWSARQLPSVKCQCSRCGMDVALAAGNQQRVQSEQMELVCMKCVVPFLPATPREKMFFALGGKLYPFTTPLRDLAAAYLGYKNRN
jgi:hypothetical protein